MPKTTVEPSPAFSASTPLPINPQMGNPVLSYATPNETSARRKAENQADLWWFLGMVITFLGPFGLLAVIDITFKGVGRVGAVLEVLAGIALFILFAIHQHRRYHSWSF